MPVPAEADAKSYQPPEPEDLKVKVEKGIARFSLPAPETYAAVVVEW